MSAFDPLKNTTIEVARSQGRDDNNEVTFGPRSEIDVRKRTITTQSDSSEGQETDTKTKLSTDEWTFEDTDGIWFVNSGDDSSKANDARTPESTGDSSTIGVSVSTVTVD